MQIKYKLRNKETGEVFTGMQGYLLNAKGDVETIILSDGTQVKPKDFIFSQFLEEVDGQDIYDGDRAVIDLTEVDYNFETYTDVVTTTRYKGEFRELYEAGLYYFIEDETDKNISYIASNVKIVNLLEVQ